MQLIVLAVAVSLALPWRVSGQSSNLGSIEEALRLSTPRFRKGSNQRDTVDGVVVTFENIRWLERKHSLNTAQSIQHRLIKEDDSRDDKGSNSRDDEPGGDGRPRTWGQASGQQVGGYHASGYQNGYTAGTYNASSVNRPNNAGPTGDHSYLGCLGLSNYELEHEWKFSGTPPSCSYVHHSKKRKKNKKKSAEASDNVTNKTCGNGWFSSCQKSQKNHTQSAWSVYYTNHFGRSTNTSNTTASSYQSAGAEEDDGPDEEGEGGEGEGGPDQEEEGMEAGEDEGGPDDEEEESDSRDDEPDDDTIVTNEVYENVNGDDFVYEQSSTTQGNGQTGWWKSWGHKTNSTANATSPQNQQEAAANENGMEEEEAVGDEEGEQPEGEGEENNYDPYDDFDLEQCDTYQNLWLWDLSLTCKGANSMDSCECSYAEELLYEGTISCEDFSLCPGDCAVCRTCFQLMGCVKTHHETSSLSPGSLAGVFVGALAFVLVGGTGYYLLRRRRKSMNGELGIHLMWSELESKAESDTESNDSAAWGASSPRSPHDQKSANNVPLFDDYYRSMDEGGADRLRQTRANAGPPVLQLNSRGETDTIGDSVGQEAGTSSVLDEENSSTDDSDESSRSSDYDSTLDGSTVLSGDDTGSPKIWLAPVDVKLDQEESALQ